jgi:hypothetical protein
MINVKHMVEANVAMNMDATKVHKAKVPNA